MAFVRKSKYKHIFGKPLKRDQCYENIRVTKSSWDSTFCAVNPKYLAIVTEAAGGGAFIVLPISQVGRLERDPPLIAGHKAMVLDIAWCPHNDDLIASASEDCTVKLWLIPEGGLKGRQNVTEPVMELIRHQRRVGLILWHPTAASILLSAGADNKVFIWNAEVGDCLVEMEFTDMITSASFNFNGSRLAVACKDRKTRILDPRTGEQLLEGQLHDGNKVQQVCYLRNGDIVTTGFSRTGDRQVAVWKTDNFSSPLAQLDLDTSNGVNFIFYDGDTNMVYLCGKGDSVLRYFEITDEEPYLHFINLFQSNEPQRGMGCMSKRGLNVNECEIMRFYKLHTKGLCEVIPFIVPRKSELFQEDLYPDTPGDMPALTAQEWFSGRDADPVLISLKEGYKPTASVAASMNRKVGPTVASNVSNKAETPTSKDAQSGGTSAVSKPSPATAAVSKPLSSHANAVNDETPRSSTPTMPAQAAAPSRTPSQPHSQATQSPKPTSTNSSIAAPAPAPANANAASNGKPQTIENVLATQATSPGGAQTVTLSVAELQQVVDDMRKMKVIIKGHEKRIKQLEDKLKQVETDLYEDHAETTQTSQAPQPTSEDVQVAIAHVHGQTLHAEPASAPIPVTPGRDEYVSTPPPASPTFAIAATGAAQAPSQFGAFPASLYG